MLKESMSEHKLSRQSVQPQSVIETFSQYVVENDGCPSDNYFKFLFITRICKTAK